MQKRDVPTGRGRAWTVGLTAMIIAAATLSPLALPQPVRPGPPDVGLLVEQAEARARNDLFSGRPTYVPEPDGPLTAASPPAALIHRALVSKTAVWQGQQLPFLVPDSALPFRYHVDRRLAERYGLEEVIAAVGQWDGIPGSRWATEFVSVVEHPEHRPRPDGTSVVYLRQSCPPGYLGGAFWNAAPARAHVEQRYGNEALFSPQVDIAICPDVAPERLPGVMAHEVGHAMGMAHLCEPGEICWRPEMADDEHRCRAMYYRFGPCRDGIAAADKDAARHLYPTLPRLYGPGHAATAARASYATTWTHRADDVIVARSDRGVLAPLLAAALAGATDAPLLLSRLPDNACLEEPAADELARAATNPGRVTLVGHWPERCSSDLSGWDLRVEHMHDPPEDVTYTVHGPAVRLSTEIATRIAEERRAETGVGPERAFLISTDEHPDMARAAAAVAAAAGRRGVPLLVTDPQFLSAPVDRWLAEHPTVGEVTVVGRPGALDDAVLDRLWAQGIVPELAVVTDPVTFAVNFATRQWPLQLGTRFEEPVVIGPLGSVGAAVVAASVAGRVEAPLLLAGVGGDHPVEQWLMRRRPVGGFLVADPDQVPYEVQWTYGTHVQPGDATPSLATRDRDGLFGAAGMSGTAPEPGTAGVERTRPTGQG